MNSREKGKRGERELAQWLTDHGYPATRGAQHRGGPDSPDVLCERLPVHWEVKRTEHLSLYSAVAQAAGEAGGQMPVVAHRRNGGPWLAVLRLEDLVGLLGRPGADERSSEAYGAL